MDLIHCKDDISLNPTSDEGDMVVKVFLNPFDIFVDLNVGLLQGLRYFFTT